MKSASDPHTYLIHDTADPLQASLSGLLLEGLSPAASPAFAPRAGGALCPSLPASGAKTSEDVCAGRSRSLRFGAYVLQKLAPCVANTRMIWEEYAAGWVCSPL